MQAFAASGLAKPYFSLEATTLYSLFTYHALPVSLGSALNQSTTHTLLETLLPLANGDGAPLVVESNGADALKIASPVEANVKLDSLDEGSSTETLSGLDLYEVDQVSRGRASDIYTTNPANLLPPYCPTPRSSPCLPLSPPSSLNSLAPPRPLPNNPDSPSTRPPSTTPRPSTP